MKGAENGSGLLYPSRAFPASSGLSLTLSFPSPKRFLWAKAPMASRTRGPKWDPCTRA